MKGRLPSNWRLSSLMLSLVQIVPPSNLQGRTKFGGKLATHSSLVVWWYGPLQKNPRAGSVPLVDVLFRRVDPDGSLRGPVFIPIGVTHLGNLRPGSVWTAGENVGRIHHTPLPSTEVSFSSSDWDYVLSQDAGLGPYGPYQIPLAHSGTWLIRLRATSGLIILVPTVEFFARCYGKTSDTGRILLSNNWEKAKNRFFYEDDTSGLEQKVRLRHEISQSESVFLAHALYDPYTRGICERIYSNLMVDFEDPSKRYKLPRLKIGPWFEGNALIQGNGVWLEDHKIFLLLDITGMSDPEGPTIVLERERFSAKGQEGGGRAYSPPSPDIPLDKRLDVTDAEEPDSDYPRRAYSEPFASLGKKRVIKKTIKKISGKRGNPTGLEKTDKDLSTGDADGRKKGIAKLVFTSEALTTHGVLADMWSSCLELGRTCEEIVKVEWFTFQHEYQTTSPPRWELFFPSEASDTPKDIQSWTYIYPKEKVPRGAIIIALTIQSKLAYIIEIERRIYGEDNEKISQQSFCGVMVLMPNSSAQRGPELKLILDNIRIRKGVIFGKTLTNLPHATFKHIPYDQPPDLFKRLIVEKLAGLGIHLNIGLSFSPPEN